MIALQLLKVVKSNDFDYNVVIFFWEDINNDS